MMLFSIYSFAILIQTQHTFQHIFNEATGQREVFDRVSMPLVKDLLTGKNGLLFTYGITNSGKTYTMSGEPDNAGILPRSLDIIFNSIAELQAPRFVSINAALYFVLGSSVSSTTSHP